MGSNPAQGIKRFSPDENVFQGLSVLGHFKLHYIYIYIYIYIEYPTVMPLARRIQKDTKRLDSDELIGRMKK